MSEKLGRIAYLDALDRLGLTAALAPFDAHVAGTPPLALDLPESDIDVLCQVTDGDAFTNAVWAQWSDHDGFIIHQWSGDTRPIVASFRAHGWTIGIFGDRKPVAEQLGWRHFVIERRLLALGGETLRAAVMKHRLRGLKTEPAFAAVLGLAGDSYLALLRLEAMEDADLAQMLRSSRL